MKLKYKMFLEIKNKFESEPLLKKILFSFNCTIFLFLSFAIWMFNGSNIFNNLISLSCIVFSIVAIIYCILYKKIEINHFVILCLLFIVFSFLSNILNDNAMSKRIFVSYAFAIILFEYAKDSKCIIKSLLGMFLLGSIAFSIFFFLKYKTEILNFDFSTRLGSDFDNLNKIAICFSLNAIIWFYLLFVKKQIYSIFFVTINILLCLATGSISNLLAICLSLLFTIIVFGKKVSRFISLFFVVGLALSLFFILKSPTFSYFNKRINGIINVFFSSGENADGSASSRLRLALDGINIFFERPLFGFGEGVLITFTHGKGYYSHNNFVELLFSFGFLGFALYYLIMFYSFKNRKIKNVFLPIVFYCSIFGFFLVTYYLKEFLFMLALAAANVKNDISICTLRIVNKKIEFKFLEKQQ